MYTSLQVNVDTDFVSLNSNEIDIHSAIISTKGSVVESKPEISTNEDAQTATIKLNHTLSAGSDAQLKLTFTGILNDDMAGFYRSSFKVNGETNYIASTQMESTDARRAFPCFDEPGLKAKFTVTLIADKSMTCLSNMDVVSETNLEGSAKKAVKFNTSPLMSTYLLAFVVGHLNYIESNSFRVPIRIYATPDQDIEHGRFSLDLAAKTLAFYEKTFDSEYPLSKMDMIAVPDFSAGAMENWGLITYRIVDLLLDEKTSGASRKQEIAETVQHELAHQWFGNLVTMDFWDGLWLKEGFATWMSWFSCNVFYPEWNVWQTYIIDTLHDALSLDSLRSSHPIEVPIYHTDEINQIFDDISYFKGSSVVRMISKYLGEDVFLQGIRNYIKKHAYGNTETDDLWVALADASGKPVQSVMNIWTKHVGYPVLSVTENPNSSSITIKQNRFLRTGDVRPEEDTIIYPCMLGLRSKDGVDEDTMLMEREGEFKVDLDFFKLNADHSAIYRTSYSPERLLKLGQAARDGLLTVEDRAGMISDCGALAASGYQKTSGLLSLLQSFDTESEFVVWDEVLRGIANVRAAWVFEDVRIQGGLKTFYRSLVTAKAHELGWQFSDEDDHVMQQFKALMFSAAGKAEDPTVVKAAHEMFAAFAAGDVAAIHPNIRGSVFSIVLKHGGTKEYEIVLDRFRHAPSSDEKVTALRCLGAAQDPSLIQRTLVLAMSGEVKTQDIHTVLGGLGNFPAGIEARWAWLKKNWDTIYVRLPPALEMLSVVVQLSTSSFCTEDQLKDVSNFFDVQSTKVRLLSVFFLCHSSLTFVLQGYDRTLEQSLDTIRAKTNWLLRDNEDVESWLKENQYL